MHLDVCLDVLLLSRRQVVGSGALAQLEVADGGQLEAQIEHRFLREEDGHEEDWHGVLYRSRSRCMYTHTHMYIYIYIYIYMCIYVCIHTHTHTYI